MKDLIILVLIGVLVVSHFGVAVVVAWLKKELAAVKAEVAALKK